MKLSILASTSKPSWERIQKRIEERRAVVENTRSMNVKRLQNDLHRIAKKEVEFAQKLVEELIPVKITWNDEAFRKLKESLPVRIEPKEDETRYEPVVAKDEPTV
jgi:hypothetical protein